jgi:hypothetical protein
MRRNHLKTFELLNDIHLNSQNNFICDPLYLNANKINLFIFNTQTIIYSLKN